MRKGIDSRLDRALADKPPALAHAVSATHLLLHSALLLEQRMEAALTPLQLQFREYLALRLLADNVHESVSPTQMSMSLKATRTQITRLLDSLEAKGLAVRNADISDRCSLALSLTPDGAALLECAIPLVEQAHTQAWATLGPANTQAMQEQLRALYISLQQH